MKEYKFYGAETADAEKKVDCVGHGKRKKENFKSYPKVAQKFP